MGEFYVILQCPYSKCCCTQDHSLAAVNKFIRDYEDYEELVRERREVYLEDVHPNSVKSCVDRVKLQGLAKYVQKITFESITDKDIRDYFNKIRGRAATATPQDIEKMIKDKVVMNQSIKESEDRDLDHFSRFDKLITDFGLSHVYSDEDVKMAKRKISVLVEGLRPLSLRAAVKRELMFGAGQTAKKNIEKTFEVILTTAQEHDRYNALFALNTDADSKSNAADTRKAMVPKIGIPASLKTSPNHMELSPNRRTTNITPTTSRMALKTSQTI